MAARVFISYSHADESLRDELEVQLAMLKRQGLINVWHDRRLLPGDHLDESINDELDQADIIILLVSPNFLASDYCYKIEKSRALERHREGSARLISVILRPCDWRHTELGEFLVTPKDGKPITRWPDRDEAFLDVANAIRQAIEFVGAAGPPSQVHQRIEPRTQDEDFEEPPRSSNLRITREFSQADKDRFLTDSFEFVDRFFQGSLKELAKRNSNIETRYRQIDGNSFSSVIYRSGEKISACTIRLGNMFGGITFAHDENADPSTCNESISVDSDNQKLFLRPMGLASFFGRPESKSLSQEGAAEYFWSIFIAPIQEKRR